MSNPVGRPSDYNEETVPKAIKYCQEYESLGEVIPSIAGLAIYLDITRETVRVWAKEENKKDFSVIVAQILATQEKKLVNSGLKDDFNSSITKLLLTKHGYSDRQELTGKDGESLIPLPLLGGQSNGISDNPSTDEATGS